MDLNSLLNSVNEISRLSERYFMDLGNLFPSLLNKEISPSLKNLQGVIKTLGENNAKSVATENELFGGMEDKYSPLFEELNKKLKPSTNSTNSLQA